VAGGPRVRPSALGQGYRDNDADADADADAVQVLTAAFSDGTLRSAAVGVKPRTAGDLSYPAFGSQLIAKHVVRERAFI
jgi:hypothetical protein